MPQARIAWPEILMRRYWHEAGNGKAIEQARKRLDLMVRYY